MVDYKSSNPDARYYDPKIDGHVISEGEEFFASWDGESVFKLFGYPDGRLLDTFLIEGLSENEAEIVARDYVSEWDQDYREDD